ncbi:hypothetical protein BgiBS90_029142, partial [Biomphalaria glabrata]
MFFQTKKSLLDKFQFTNKLISFRTPTLTFQSCPISLRLKDFTPASVLLFVCFTSAKTSNPSCHVGSDTIRPNDSVSPANLESESRVGMTTQSPG